MSTARHSASWAVRVALGPEAAALPEELIFGLGGSLWFRWDRGSHRMSGLHPHRIHRALLALNVTTMAFRHLDPAALGYLAERGKAGEPTLVMVPGPGAAPLCRSPRWRCLSDLALVVTGFEGSADDPQAVVRFLHPQEGPQEAPAGEFVDLWMGGAQHHRCGGWIVPLCVRLRFDPRFSERRALWLFAEQMTARFSTLGACGLPGLAELADALEGKRAGALLPLDAPAGDGGGSLHRDTMAAFVRLAAETLGRNDLRPAAALLEHSGALWAEVRTEAVDAASVARRVRAILALEREAVSLVQRANRWEAMAS